MEDDASGQGSNPTLDVSQKSASECAAECAGMPGYCAGEVSLLVCFSAVPVLLWELLLQLYYIFILFLYYI